MIRFKTTITPVPVTKFHIVYETIKEIQIDSKRFLLEKKKSDILPENQLRNFSTQCGTDIKELKDQLLQGKTICSETEYEEGHYVQLFSSHYSTIVIVFKGLNITDIVGIETYYLEDPFTDVAKRLNNVQSELDIYGSPIPASGNKVSDKTKKVEETK